ncbi:MAG: lysophospholipid acyltransferase family protein [Bacteroidales bacterium]|jgi:KDO2-lipid IV(A) lauroyltransferase|nr:lysophospholipid acyltransferase family protein [Bacteroidales bacterium]
MKLIEFILFRTLVLVFSIIPYKVLYFFSNITYFFIYKLIGYREKIVSQNLKNSFPEKSDDEILILCKKFYHHLTDITLESIKVMSISKKAIEKKYLIKNTEILDEYFEKKQSILCLTSHYGNWEYGILETGNKFKHKAIALYLPLTNKYSEKYGVKRRSRFGTKLVAVQESKKIFTEDLDIPKAIILAADQNPANKEKSIWVNFLNQDTACLHGPEAYAKKTNFPVVYFNISKTKRGFYELTIEKLIENPSELEPNKITEIYMKRLEKDINLKPEYWLWSHRRWKFGRGE